MHNPSIENFFEPHKINTSFALSLQSGRIHLMFVGFGGGNRVRTDDPLLAGQVLYQLSYTPISALFAK